MSKSMPAAHKDLFEYQDGKATRNATFTFYRGDGANFYPSDDTLERSDAIPDYFVKGLMPAAPLISKEDRIIAFGSCFADNISRYLDKRGYNVLTRKDRLAYVSRLGDGIVNSYAVRQQFEWAWNKRVPEVEIWHGFDAEAFGYSEAVRERTEALFNEAAVFIITLGLSEIWYDQPTGEVFWRAIPANKYDSSRHKFRVASHLENLENIRAIHGLIRKHRPSALIVFTLSPIPLTATFRKVSCTVANSASKSLLRSALDEFMREAADDTRLFYFPSYEIVLDAFEHQFMEDRKHVHKHVLDFNMTVFEHFFCGGVQFDKVNSTFREARALDDRVGRHGHWSVPRTLEGRKGLQRKAPPFRFAISNMVARLASLWP